MAIPLIYQTFEVIFLFYTCTFIVASIASFIFIRSLTTHTIIHHKIIILCTLVFVIGCNIYSGITIVNRLSLVPHLISSTPKNAHTLPFEKPIITIEFSDPLLFSSLQINAFPDNEFIVKPDGYLFNLLPIGRFVTIIPKHSFPRDSTIMIYLSNIEGPLTHGYGGETLLELQSVTNPKIISILSPAIFTDVPTNQDIRILLDKPNDQFSEWTAHSIPIMEFESTFNDNELLIHPLTLLQQGVTYSVTLKQKTPDSDPVEMRTITFTTTHPPFVENVYPKRQMLYPSEDITIEFKQPMQTKEINSLFFLSPSVPSSVVWEKNNTKMIIRHAPFPKNASISATISKDLRTEAGGKLESDIQFNFKTPGALAIESSSPKNTDIDFRRDQPIAIQFNQPIVSSTVPRSITVDPKFPFTSLASESSILIQPLQKLNPETQYTINLSHALLSVYGSPAENPLSYTFVTDPDRVILPVPYYRQESSFSCNIAAARMLLAYKQINVSEKEIIASAGNGGVRGSGNPNSGYVPDYGTYWDALAKGISPYSKYTILQNSNLKSIISSISDGKPIMIWGQNGWSDPHDISWTTKDGSFIKAVNGMHSSVVHGYSGTAQNPTEIYLNDPWRGQYAIPTSEFLRRWGYFKVALVLE